MARVAKMHQKGKKRAIGAATFGSISKLFHRMITDSSVRVEATIALSQLGKRIDEIEIRFEFT